LTLFLPLAFLPMALAVEYWHAYVAVGAIGGFLALALSFANIALVVRQGKEALTWSSVGATGLGLGVFALGLVPFLTALGLWR